jgi:CRP-like cAMP-binding protein
MMSNSPLQSDFPTFQLTAGSSLYELGTRQGSGWRLLSGTLRLDLTGCSRQHLVQLALPGDLLGLEPLYGAEHQATARALVDCQLQALQAPDANDPRAMATLLAQALGQQWRRATDMAALRTGATPERVRRLLQLLRADTDSGAANPTLDHALPRIKDIAALVDSAHETVSRILSGLRRMKVLQERHPQFASIDPQRLDNCELPKGMTRSSPWVQRPRPARAVAEN